MAQSAITVTPTNPTPPTNMSFSRHHAADRSRATCG